MPKDLSTLNHPIVVLVRGLPGSGKSYLANKVAQALETDRVVELDPDATDYESREYKEHVNSQKAQGVDESLHAYRFLRAKAYKGIEENKIVIWNQPFTNKVIFQKMVGRFYDHAHKHNKKMEILVVQVEIDPSMAKQRLNVRKKNGGHGPSDNTFNRFTNDYHIFKDAGYNSITVNGDNSVTKSVQQVIKSIYSLI